MVLSKYLIIGLSFIVLIIATGFALASQSDKTLLVLDMKNSAQLPRHFRDTAHVPRSTNINWSGIDDLHIAGSAQFSKLALQAILNRLKTSQVAIIDLRQESHGFLNGNAISWYGFRNGANANLSSQAIEDEQATRLAELSSKLNANLDNVSDDQTNPDSAKEDDSIKNINNPTDDKLNDKLGEGVISGPSVVVYNILQKAVNGSIEKTKPIEFVIHAVSSEEELAAERHLPYYRIYVQDFHAPSDEQVDRFIDIVNHLPKNKWIYLHCRGGVGRTTTFMIMYDIMRNAKQVKFEDILARQHAIDGKDLSQLPEENNFKYELANERLAFLKRFYAYAHDNKDQFSTSWTTWQGTGGSSDDE